MSRTVPCTQLDTQIPLVRNSFEVAISTVLESALHSSFNAGKRFLDEEGVEQSSCKRQKVEFSEDEGQEDITGITPCNISWSPSNGTRYTCAAIPLFHPLEIVAEGDKVLHFSLNPWKDAEPVVLVSQKLPSSPVVYRICRKVGRKRWLQVQLPASNSKYERVCYAGEDQYLVTPDKGDVQLVTVTPYEEPSTGILQATVVTSFKIGASLKDIQLDILGHVWVLTFDGYSSNLRAFARDGTCIFDFHKKNQTATSSLPFLMNVSASGVYVYCTGSSSLLMINLNSFAITTLVEKCPVIRCKCFAVSLDQREVIFAGRKQGTLDMQVPRFYRQDIDTQEVEEFEAANYCGDVLIPVASSHEKLFTKTNPKDPMAAIFMLNLGSDL